MMLGNIRKKHTISNEESLKKPLTLYRTQQQSLTVCLLRDSCEIVKKDFHQYIDPKTKHFALLPQHRYILNHYQVSIDVAVGDEIQYIEFFVCARSNDPC